MSYELISETLPHARKPYRCIWCNEAIPRGDVHVHEISKYDGGFQNLRWHQECKKASARWFKEDPDCCDFPPGEFRRGTTESVWTKVCGG